MGLGDKNSGFLPLCVDVGYVAVSLVSDLLYAFRIATLSIGQR